MAVGQREAAGCIRLPARKSCVRAADWERRSADRLDGAEDLGLLMEVILTRTSRSIAMRISPLHEQRCSHVEGVRCAEAVSLVMLFLASHAAIDDRDFSLVRRDRSLA